MLITISGSSCTGKTTLANAICDKFQGFDTIGLDSYCLDRHHLLQTHDFFDLNHDLPECYDLQYAYRDLVRALNGQCVQVPRYEFKSLKSFSDVEAKTYKHVVFEGLYVNLDRRIRMLSDISIHLECSRTVMLNRRLYRDQLRGISDIERNRIYFMSVALPTYDRFGRPQRLVADYCVDTEYSGSTDHLFRKIENDIS